jgi:histidinol-phosphate aminotransferase
MTNQLSLPSKLPLVTHGLSILDLSRNEKPDAVPDSLYRELEKAIARIGRYPVNLEAEVIELIADCHQVGYDNVMLVHGIDEALDALITHFPDLAWKTFHPTFEGYDIRFRVHGREHQSINLGATYDIENVGLKHVSRRDFVVLANPNNPTGCQVNQNVLSQLIDNSAKLLIDEAYIHFSNQPSVVPSLSGGAFVFHSLSKAFGLAGQRLGFLFGPAHDIRQMRQRQWYCNIDLLSLTAIRHILLEKLHESHAKQVIQRRESLVIAIRALGYDVISTETNFLLIRTQNAAWLTDFMEKNRILVFNTAQFGLPFHVRISIGTDEDNERLVDCLKSFSPSKNNL